jgi:5-methylcytosine-specific restriction endonuclease McrA
MKAAWGEICRTEKGNKKARARVLPDLYLCQYCGKGFQGKINETVMKGPVPNYEAR